MINDLRNALGWMAMKLREVLIVFITFNNHKAVFLHRSCKSSYNIQYI